MKLFGPLYDLALRWSRHRHAPRYLAGLSFAEATFFPVPPDVMLAPMVLGQRDQAWRLALLCTVASVVGGLFGYLIGHFAFQWVEPLLVRMDYMPAFQRAQQWFVEYGFWIIVLAGFSPIPYKVFTIAAGVAALPLPLFVLGSMVGRAGRFFMVAGIIYAGGPDAEQAVRRNVERLGWASIVLAVIVVLWLVFRHSG